MHASRALACAGALLLIPIAAAHVPSVGPESRLLDVGRSSASYEDLPAGAVDTWTFHAARGDPLFLVIGVPTGNVWSPQASLLGPGGFVPLVRAEDVSFEPFTPYASRDVWTLDVPAPADGDYTLRITGGGRYVLGFGLAEAWTPAEWATIPLAALQVHRWEGQPWAGLALPYAATLAGATLLARAPRSRAPPALAVVASALLAGTALERVAQLGLALVEGARPAAWALAVAVVLPGISVALAVAAWRARRAWALLVVAAGAVVAWAGLLVAPALLVGAAVDAIVARRRIALRPPAA